MSPSAARTPAPDPSRYKFTVDEFHELVAAGFFKREDCIELIEGELIMMPPPSPEHSAHTSSLRERLERLLPAKFHLRVGDPVTITPRSEPVPDFAVVKRRQDFYKSGHPAPADVFLIIEVSKTSAGFDTAAKSTLYGAAGIPEYWVLDIEKRTVHAFSGPSRRGYRTQRSLQSAERLSCRTIPALEFGVDEMLL